MEYVTDILKIGLSGFVFLLVWFAYKLLRREQEKKTPSTRILTSVRNYLWMSVILAVLVGTFGLVEKLVPPPETDLQPYEIQLQDCRDSFTRLETFSQRENVKPDAVLKVIGRHISTCKPTYQILETTLTEQQNEKEITNE